MQTLRNLVPSLNALIVFESASRLGGFTKAGQEIGIDQAAVSRHIRGLESAIGHSLFVRDNNRIHLTEPGRKLAEVCTSAFEDISRTVESLRQPTNPQTLIFATHSGFAQQWLLPRLPDLSALLGDMELNLSIWDLEQDFDQGQFDVAVRHGLGDWQGVDGERLFDEEVIPVVGLSLFAKNSWLADAQAVDLLRLPLIHMDSGSQPWMTWDRWMKLCGVSEPLPRPALLHSNYPLVLQAALAGRGVALGWRQLVEPLLNSGALVAVGPAIRRESCGYDFLLSKTSLNRKYGPRILAWLQGELATNSHARVS